MTPDFIMGDTPETTGIPNTGPTSADEPEADDVREDVESGSRVKVYDGLVVDPAGNPGTIGADANGS